jgi:LPXTG-motif cell wall-anchored protein
VAPTPTTPPTTTPVVTTPTTPAAPETAVLAETQSRLPVTGASTTPWLAGLAAMLLASGTGLVSRARRLAHREP